MRMERVENIEVLQMARELTPKVNEKKINRA
jgi:hypothetical protein